MTIFESPFVTDTGYMYGSDSGFFLALLGGFCLISRQSTLAVPRASQRLLAFLALHQRMVSRAAVAGTLWPETSESRAYCNLRSAIARLRSTARNVLVASKLELGLAEGVAVDLRLARRLAQRLLNPTTGPEESELGLTMVAALSCDLLPDWYDDWIAIEAEEWLQLRMHALEAMAGRLSTVGRWGEAVGAAGAAVRADPLRESARAALIQVHLAHGNQSDAVREFVRYQTLLAAELGLAPSQRLRELLQSVQTRVTLRHRTEGMVGR